jgi:hypothetical protein
MRFSEQYPQSVRLRRMAELGTALITLQDGRTTEAQALAIRQADEHARPDFDIEAATNTLSLWARLDQLGLVQDGYEALVRSLSRRFCVSKASTEVLRAAVRHQPLAEEWIREAHAEVMRVAEQAMNHALGGRPAAAVGPCWTTVATPATPSSSTWLAPWRNGTANASPMSTRC